MRLFSNQLRGPKISAFLRAFPFLFQNYGSKPFEVREAIKRINAAPDLRLWCHQSINFDILEKKRQEANGKTLLDLQNACHCFSGITRSAVIDKDTGKEIRLLIWIEKMTYRMADNAEELFNLYKIN